jgi:hypothetical protein
MSWGAQGFKAGLAGEKEDQYRHSDCAEETSRTE